MIPRKVNGNKVIFFALLDTPKFPRGYPGDGPIEETKCFLISVSDEGRADDERFWVSCLGKSGKIMAGEICYTLESAMEFPPTEFDVADLKWISAEQQL